MKATLLTLAFLFCGVFTSSTINTAGATLQAQMGSSCITVSTVVNGTNTTITVCADTFKEAHKQMKEILEAIE
ncbi:hypothetical protein [Lewinella sp. W8]|uniref:hypothetical protein n=1 Tax=Lewinella sp. W8 TaxID=2528208 RepID=UPI0010685819|nr:hypothetical protein [Lewinella sp. W8]MTB53298.1 hypothetical protein [Lewinella sp. W8]